MGNFAVALKGSECCRGLPSWIAAKAEGAFSAGLKMVGTENPRRYHCAWGIEEDPPVLTYGVWGVPGRPVSAAHGTRNNNISMGQLEHASRKRVASIVRGAGGVRGLSPVRSPKLQGRRLRAVPHPRRLARLDCETPFERSERAPAARRGARVGLRARSSGAGGRSWVRRWWRQEPGRAWSGRRSRVGVRQVASGHTALALRRRAAQTCPSQPG